MVIYNSEKDYIKDQISIYNCSINTIKWMQFNYGTNSLREMRGDNKKVIDALKQVITHLKA